MAKYTIQLRSVCDMFGEEEVLSWFEDYDLSDYLTQEEIDLISSHGVWSKGKLSRLIVDHYWMREIGLETPALFRHQAKVLMREIMEYKAPLIWSASIHYDPLVNMDLKEIYSQDQTNNENTTNNGSSTSNSSGLSVASDTPQGQISKSDILSGKYASSTGADETTDTSTTNTNTVSSGNGTMNYTKQIIGNSGVSFTPMSAITDYRKIIVSINRDIVNEVGELFMGVY